MKAKSILTKKGQTIINNTELWGNKGDGLRVKLMKTHILNCKIKQNIHGAVFLESKVSEHLIKIYCDPSRTNDIKGKIYGDNGLIYPRIMI